MGNHDGQAIKRQKKAKAQGAGEGGAITGIPAVVRLSWCAADVQAVTKLTPEERLRRGRLVLSNFGLLRGKLGAPHPSAMLVNPLVQVSRWVV